MGRVIACIGIMLVALGWAFGRNCDFDTMILCRPLGLFDMDAFSASGGGGLLLLLGGGLALAGCSILLVRRLRRALP